MDRSRFAIEIVAVIGRAVRERVLQLLPVDPDTTPLEIAHRS
jgi:hypothetical protein